MPTWVAGQRPKEKFKTKEDMLPGDHSNFCNLALQQDSDQPKRFSFFAPASPWTLPASNQSMIWEPNLRGIVNRLLLLWYYLAFRVVILHDRHLPSIAAHNNSHRGCRPRQPRETQHCTLCTELVSNFEQIMNHFPDPGHNPWLQLAFPLKFLLIHRRVPAAWQQKQWHSCGLCLLTESNYSDCISTDYLQPLICRHMHWPNLESEFDDNDKGEKSSRDKNWGNRDVWRLSHFFL